MSSRWVKGQSGNPAGRPRSKFSAHARKATDDGKLLVEFQVRVVKAVDQRLRGVLGEPLRDDEDAPEFDPTEPTVLDAQRACVFLRDSGFGKPTETRRIVSDGEDTSDTWDVSELTDEELDAIERVQAKARPVAEPGDGTGGEGPPTAH